MTATRPDAPAGTTPETGATRPSAGQEAPNTPNPALGDTPPNLSRDTPVKRGNRTTPSRRPWHQIAPLPDDAGWTQASRHYAAQAYAHLLALAEPGAPKRHARTYEAAFVAAMTLNGLTWPSIAHSLADAERAACQLHTLLRWVDINPDDIAPAGDDQ